MIDREEAHRLLDAAFDHLDREAAENSADKRDSQQKAALRVIDNFLNCAGWRDLLQRRLVTFIQGKPAGSPSQASELAPLVEKPRNFRRAEARLLGDLHLMPGSLRAIWSMVAAEDGYDGAHGGGGIYEPDPRAGVDKQGGAAIEALKINLVEMIGYTAGATGLPKTRRLTNELLQRAHEAWRRHTLSRTGKSPDPVAPKTIRIWCTKPGRLAEVFNEAYEKGRRDQLHNRIDRSKLLARID
jgi:hypothetical protein